MKVLAIALALVAVVSAGKIKWSDELIDNFQNFDKLDVKPVFFEWASYFKKSYSNTQEEAERFLIWLDNYYNILKHNHNPSRGNYTLRLNQFADMTGDEFRVYVHGHTGSCLKKSAASTRKIGGVSQASKVGANPTSVDWRTQGVVTPVKNQGSCGSCWAFSATGATECRYAIKNKELNSLSEQQLVDCSRSYGNEGCSGGLMDDAFKYIIAEGGLCSETAYPYEGVDGTCKATTCGTKYDDISAYTDVVRDNEGDLETAAVSGCVSVAIEADQFAFQYYSGGILDGTCGTNLDHGVLIVGYNNEGSEEYWIVKNSWGTSWGIEGYVYICKDCDKNGKKGECGINEEPSYPVSS